MITSCFCRFCIHDLSVRWKNCLQFSLSAFNWYLCNAKLKNWTERREGEDWQQNWEQSCLQITEHVHFYPSSTVHNEEKKNNYVYYLPILPLLTKVMNFLAPCLHTWDQHWLWFFLLVWKVADMLDSWWLLSNYRHFEGFCEEQMNDDKRKSVSFLSEPKRLAMH